MSHAAEDIEKKLNKLKKGSFPDKLTYEALILLLQHDPHVRQLVRNIVERDADADQCVIDDAQFGTQNWPKESLDIAGSGTGGDIRSDMNSSSGLVVVDSGCSQRLPVQPDSKETLRVELSSALRLLALVERHTGLRSYLLAGCDSEGERLMKLLVNLGRWDQIEMIWNTLAADIKQRQQMATADELGMLEGCLQCFNLTSSQYKAALDRPQPPQNFNHKVHNRLNAKGQTVTAIALPGLINSAGDTVCKALVITE
ncbi:hypothetical protein [Parathalassolituus penaei]|uniref:Uncharacterized protein n=1 Tax=Parathalassolituus penaei TaxID=2997323 RepID=A0A9X3ECQ2_9GAMM|nr:hypothetical protein [Parathalassolituus penaei]MCY0965174.1 hypothetical protein [Parathalassolituus penaei]